MAEEDSTKGESTTGTEQMWRAGPSEHAERPGDSIGPYRLLSILGEGGFGIVWLAERREPHVQRVALKIIKPGMDSKAVIARFEQERQALAVMDHPNVAKVYDAGTTPQGRPYFIMELVQGEPITEYCDRHNLTIRQRLELFIPVCEAIQHAHTKGVIHRDIKPSNVLVTIKDENPIPKVIDFGVAKAISHTLTDKTIFTEHGQIIGTPEYMSPEQAEMGALDIDTRTDVFSLGVLLYELLTGVLPFDAKELRSKGYAEIQRIIREVDPPRPSTKLTSMASADPPALEGGGEGAGELKVSKRSSATAIANHRQTRLDALVKELRTELEWIPLKAMRKDRLQRYGTAHDFANDIQKYLSALPIDAAPESSVYRLRKFTRRHRGPVAAGIGIVLSLGVGLAGSLYFLRQAVLSRDAEREQRQRANLHWASLLDQYAAIQMKMGDLSAAEKDYRDALRIRQECLGSDHMEVVASHWRLGNFLNQYRNALDECEELYEDALVITRRSQEGDKRNLENALLILGGFLLNSRGDPAGAEPLFREALDLCQSRGGVDDSHFVNAVCGLADVLERQMKFSDAEPRLIECYEIAARSLRISVEWPADMHERVRQQTKQKVMRLVEFYDVWHSAEPGYGHDAKAQEWRAILDDFN